MKLIHDELIKNGYRLVFEDHFDGDTLNKDTWNVVEMRQDGHGGRGAFRKEENLAVKDSNLTITAKIEENGDYTSGMINTSNSLCYKYGYAEIRAKLPKGGKGIWPGFWTKSDYKGALLNTEIDIFEMFEDDTKIESTLHAWWRDRIYNKPHHISFGAGENSKKILTAPSFSDDYHTIGYYWTPEFVEFAVDGEPFTHVDINNPMYCAFHTPIYFIISMAFGLTHISAPDEDRTEPIEYKLDYIRLYQDENGELVDFNEDGTIKKRE